MKLTFLGTRGNIDTRTRRHGMHSAMRVSYYDVEIIFDCGEDWLGQVGDWDADGIVVTHAHPDHAYGLKEGAPCPVFATEASWEAMEGFDIEERRTVPERDPVLIGGGGGRAGHQCGGVSRAPFDAGAGRWLSSDRGPCGRLLRPGCSVD